MSRPFIKWAGGKRQLLSELKKRFPSKYKRYIEPFIGGGALFFELKPENAFISDINEELINAYVTVKNNVEALIKELKVHNNDPDYYYEIRDADRTKKYKDWDPIKKASRFIFLNKTCFNGLYRVNSKGQFNTPFGTYTKPNIVDETNLRACSNVLQSTEIQNSDFDIVLSIAKKGDFVYFDPPYMPISDTSNFTSYTDAGFDTKMQLRLYSICEALDKKGVFWMLSNSHIEFILERYGKYNIHKVGASRSINCKGERRGKIDEVIITNYEVAL